MPLDADHDLVAVAEQSGRLLVDADARRGAGRDQVAGFQGERL